MAKKKHDTGKKLFDSQDVAHAMPEGFYSGDQPNAQLRKFVETSSTDSDKLRKIEAFNEPLDESKATAMYDLHSYHQGKKAHDGIIRYINHYTTEGELVLDPFLGSGSTCLAALLTGRSAIGIDRSPASTFIASNYCSPCSVSDLASAFERVLEATEKEVGWVYKTKSGDDKDGEIIFQLWSQTFKCSRCLAATPVFEAPEQPVANKAGKPSQHSVCPHCLKRGVIEAIDSKPERSGLVPVATSYECVAKPKRRFRTRQDSDKQEAAAFKNTDLPLIEKVQSQKIPYPFPTSLMLNCEDKAWGYLWRPYLDGIERVCDFFTHRNNLVLATYIHFAQKLGGSHKHRLLFLLTSVLWHASKMSQYKEGGGGIMPGLYYVPPVHKEQNVLRLLRRKFADFLKAYGGYSPSSTNLCLSTQSSTDLSAIPSNSIDYIFTDPPYADKVQYGEANHLWEAWLGLDTKWRTDEIIINPVLGRDEDEWCHMMRKAMSECFRVLKPGRWLTLCYHDSSEGTWALVQDMMAEAGFVVAPSDKAIYFETKQKSPKQLTTAKATKRDLILNYKKPAPGDWVVSQIYIPADADVPTFWDIGQAIVTEYLTAHPGASKDRIYDALVSRMVSRGQMESHDFGGLLQTVAECVDERWYLKSATDEIDSTEKDKEDATAHRLEAFIVSELRKTPEKEGIHYSDLFEEFLPVQDKPRRLLADWLPEFFIKTPSGTWRLPDREEKQQLAELREAGTLRKIKRFANSLIEGAPVRDRDRPGNDVDLLEWLRQCRRAGLYEQGKAIYEKGGMNSANITDEQQIEAEDDYRICARRGSTEVAKPKRKSRKKQDNDE